VCGSYVNVQHELLLICTRRSCTPDRLTPAIASVQTIQKSGVHRQKPDQFYGIIERLDDGPYLELFARRPRAAVRQRGCRRELRADAHGRSRARHDDRRHVGAIGVVVIE